MGFSGAMEWVYLDQQSRAHSKSNAVPGRADAKWIQLTSII